MCVEPHYWIGLTTLWNLSTWLMKQDIDTGLTSGRCFHGCIIKCFRYMQKKAMQYKIISHVLKNRKDNFGTVGREPLLKEPLALCFIIPDFIVYLFFFFYSRKKKCLSLPMCFVYFFPCSTGDMNSGLPACYALTAPLSDSLVLLLLVYSYPQALSPESLQSSLKIHMLGPSSRIKIKNIVPST